MRTKILFLNAILLFVVLVSHAQINKDRYLLGGSLNAYKAKNIPYTTDSKLETLNVNIQAGKVVKDNTVVGLILSYGFINSYYTDSKNYNKYNQYNAGIFYRKYKRLLKDFYLFGETDAVYSYSKNKRVDELDSAVNSNSVSNGGLISFVPGLSYSIFKKLQIELLMPNLMNVSYSHTKTTYANSTSPDFSEKGNVFSFNASLNGDFLSNFGIGFKFLLGK